MLNHESSSGVSQCYSCSEFKVYQINEFNFKMYKMLFCGSMLQTHTILWETLLSLFQLSIYNMGLSVKLFEPNFHPILCKLNIVVYIVTMI